METITKQISDLKMVTESNTIANIMDFLRVNYDITQNHSTIIRGMFKALLSEKEQEYKARSEKSMQEYKAVLSYKNSLMILNQPTIEALKGVVDAINSKTLSMSVVSERAEKIVSSYNELVNNNG